eukprot:56001_1
MAFTFSAIAIVGFMCIISCTQMVLFDLEWDASGLFLKMKFNSSVNVNISSCNTSILDLNIRKIVSQYSIFHCIWYSNRILYMYPSYNSTFNSISIPSSSVYNYNPYIILQAPTMINPCFNLIVSIKQSFNNGGRSLKYKWEINNSTEWNVPLDESKLFLPNYYLSNFIDSYLEIKLICSNWLGLSTTIFHTIYVQLISYCDSSLGYILINNGNKQQLQPNWNNYPLSISIHSNINTDTKTNDYFSIKWYQIFTPNSMGNNFKQFNFNFKTKFSADTIEWNYENDFDNTTILLPIFSTKQSNDYIFSVEVCDVDKNTLLCLWDYVFIRSKYPTPEPIKTKSQIEYINPRIKTEYTFNINTFFNFHPRYLLEYNNDFNLIQIITKTCILALTSIIFSLITVSFIVYKYGTDTDVFYMHSITNILTSFDISTNFLTVMLCMKYFDKYYHKLCGICIHKQCESCWYYIMDKSLKKQKHETESSIDSPKQTPSDNVSGSTPDIQDKNPKLTLQEQTLSLSIISSIKSATKTHHSCMSPIAENTETDSSKKTFKMSKSLKKTKSNNSGLKLPSAIIPSLKLKNTLSLSLMQASTPNNEIQAHDQITPDDDMHLAGTVYLAE